MVGVGFWVVRVRGVEMKLTGFRLHRYSRVQVFSTCGVVLGLELLVWGAVVKFWGVPQVLTHGG